MSDRALWTFLGLAAAFIAAVVYIASHKSNKWTTFKAAHHCEVTSEHRTQLRPQPVGKTMLFMPYKQQAWLCDDGRTYWR